MSLYVTLCSLKLNLKYFIIKKTAAKVLTWLLGTVCMRKRATGELMEGLAPAGGKSAGFSMEYQLEVVFLFATETAHPFSADIYAGIL
jgi:hypothetical protein